MSNIYEIDRIANQQEFAAKALLAIQTSMESGLNGSLEDAAEALCAILDYVRILNGEMRNAINAEFKRMRGEKENASAGVAAPAEARPKTT